MPWRSVVPRRSNRLVDQSLTVQLGRADVAKNAKTPPLPGIDLFSGARPASDVRDAFTRAGMTDREMTALLSGLLTLELVQKSRSKEDWREASRPKYRERGKIGRMSEFKPLTDEDFAQAELEDDPDYVVSGDDDLVHCR